MSETDLAMAIVAASALGGASSLLFLLGKRQWTWMGLFIAVGCLIAAIAHLQVLVQMVVVSGYATAPINIGAITWHRGLVWGLLLLAVSANLLGAMVAALRPIQNWSAPVICTASIYVLLSTGTSAVERWTAEGILPSLSIGIPWPVWAGFPAFMVLILGPFLCAIPWSLLRRAEAQGSETVPIVLRYWLMLGILGILLFLIGASAVLGVLKGGWGEDPRSVRIALVFIFALSLTVGGALYVAFGFRRNFLNPAISIIEGIKSDRPITETVDSNSIWLPIARSLDATKAQLWEARVQLQSFVDNVPMALTITDLSGKHVLVNPVAARHHGAAATSMVGADPSDNFAGRAEFEQYMEQGQRVAETKRAHVFEVTSRDGASGKDKSVLVTFFPLFNAGGEVVQVGTIATDITEVVEAKAEAENARREAEKARAMLQAFSDNVPAGLSIKDRERNFTMINEFSARSYYAAKAGDLIGKNAESLRTSRHGDHLYGMEQKVLDTGKPQTMEVAYKAPDDQQRHMHLMFFPIRDDSGAITHIGSLTSDITEHRQDQQELASSQATLQAFFDNLPGLAFMTTTDGRIVKANSYSANRYGIEALRPERLVGQSDTVLGPPALAQAIEGDRDRILDGQDIVEGEHEFEMPQGKTFFAVKRFPVHSATGEVSYIGGMIFDKTAEKRAEAELDASRESLHQTEKLAALGQLLAGVSHELNNPLAAVIGQAGLLAEDLEGTDHADRVSKIQRAADRCARIVQSFLALARQKPAEYRVVLLGDLVRQAVELTEYQMRASNVEVTVDLDPASPAIEADIDQLHQVLVNLLTNARQAIEDIDGPRRIDISSKHKGGKIELRIADNGKGIPAEVRGRIFDPFFTTKDVGSGTGIGLSFSLGIIEAHGGKLELEEPAVGTSFLITLDAAQIQNPGITGEQVQSPSARGLALVIDDESDIAETLRDMLSRIGFEVQVAIGGKAGISALSGNGNLDLVLCDIRMPEVDGQAVFAWISENRPDLLERLAFVSGDTLGDSAARFLSATGSPVLEKPFTPAALREFVERIVQ